MDYASLVCSVVAFLLYYNTLDAGFVYDDRRAILSNADLLPTTPWSRLLEDDFWGTPLTDSGSHGSYRPFCVLTFRLNYLLGGFQPWGYHLVNVLLHCLATVLLVRVARHILPSIGYKFPSSKKRPNLLENVGASTGPTITGLLFATHPIHTEAVAGVVGRADLAACVLYFLAFLAYVRHVRCRETVCCRRKLRCGKDCSGSEDDADGPGHKHGQGQVYRGARYHRFVVSLHQHVPVTNCNWPRRLSSTSLHSAAIHNSHFRHAAAKHFIANDTDISCCWKQWFQQWLWLIVCCSFGIAAMLSKETGITVLAVCAMFDVARHRNVNKRQWCSIAVLGSTGFLLLLVRLQGPTPLFSTADNPTAKDPYLITRFLTFIYLPVLNFFLLLCPISLSFDWGMDAVPKITHIRDIRNLYSFAFYWGLFILGKYCYSQLQLKETSMVKSMRYEGFREEKMCQCTVCHYNLNELHSQSCRSNNNNNTVYNYSSCYCLRPLRKLRPTSRSVALVLPILMALAFLTLPFLPATNLLFYVGFVVAERVLYLPSAGLCLLLGWGGAQLWARARWRMPTLVSLVFVLVLFSARTVIRNRDWLDEESLYRSAVLINPPKAYGNLGSVLSNQGRVAEAEWAFQEALRHRPNMADVHYNLGVLLQGKQQINDAVLSFQRAIHFRPSLALAYVNLGSALIKAGRCQEAAAVLRRGSRLEGTGLRDRREHDTARVSALLQLGALYSDQGRLRRALATYREAAHSLPQHYPPQSVFNVLGETLARLQQDEEAERWYQAALNAQPDHVPAHITYGKLLARNMSRSAEAEQYFRRAQKLAPEDPSVYHHYGEFLASRGRHKEAAVLYEKAAELRPREFELAVATATAMRQAGRHSDAERWYRRAVILKPSDARGHTNLGAILHLNGKYREAAESYREALRLQPNDVTTLTNLHRLHSVMT